MTRWMYVIGTALALGGCSNSNAQFHAQTPRPYVQSAQTRTAWDGLVDSPPASGRPRVVKFKKIARAQALGSDGIAAKEAELATFKAYSPEWWSVRDGIDRARDAKLARTLIICKGCLPAVSEDRTGSINAQ